MARASQLDCLPHPNTCLPHPNTCMACVLFLAAVSAQDRRTVSCEIDTLREEFGVVALNNFDQDERHCCGALRRFLKVAQSLSQPWKLEVCKLSGYHALLRIVEHLKPEPICTEYGKPWQGSRRFAAEIGVSCEETCAAHGELCLSASVASINRTGQLHEHECDIDRTLSVDSSLRMIKVSWPSRPTFLSLSLSQRPRFSIWHCLLRKEHSPAC